MSVYRQQQNHMKFTQNHIRDIRQIMLMNFIATSFVLGIGATLTFHWYLLFMPIIFVAMAVSLNHHITLYTLSRLWWILLPVKMHFLHLPGTETSRDPDIRANIRVYSPWDHVVVSYSQRELMLIKLAATHL